MRVDSRTLARGVRAWSAYVVRRRAMAAARLAGVVQLQSFARRAFARALMCRMRAARAAAEEKAEAEKAAAVAEKAAVEKAAAEQAAADKAAAMEEDEGAVMLSPPRLIGAGHGTAVAPAAGTGYRVEASPLPTPPTSAMSKPTAVPLVPHMAPPLVATETLYPTPPLPARRLRDDDDECSPEAAAEEGAISPAPILIRAIIGADGAAAAKEGGASATAAQPSTPGVMTLSQLPPGGLSAATTASQMPPLPPLTAPKPVSRTVAQLNPPPAVCVDGDTTTVAEAARAMLDGRTEAVLIATSTVGERSSGAGKSLTGPSHGSITATDVPNDITT